MSDDEKSSLGEFGARLESDDIDVVRGALDDFQSAQADTRWGVDNPYWPLASKVRSAARGLLGQPPSGDSHASALTVMWHLAEEEDANSTTSAGTFSGVSAKNVPSIRTVPHCTAHPSLVAGRRLSAARPPRSSRPYTPSPT